MVQNFGSKLLTAINTLYKKIYLIVSDSFYTPKEEKPRFSQINIVYHIYGIGRFSSQLLSGEKKKENLIMGPM